MDTRFWGPSGWKLLHVISFLYPSKPSSTEKKNMLEFLNTLPYILPCKFCRHSLTCYYEKDPPETALKNQSSLTRWLWRIHNQVNNKLRSQNLNPSSNPSFDSVTRFYKVWLKDTENYSCYLSTFWDFLFAVAYNHPKETQRQSKPMPNCPESVYTCVNNSEKNKWNILPYSVRMRFYKKFWALLPEVFGTSLKTTWIRAEEITVKRTKNRKSTLAWLWRMRCEIDIDFKDPYTQVCRKISNYSSECSKSLRGKTCRRKSKTLRRITRKSNVQKRIH